MAIKIKIFIVGLLLIISNALFSQNFSNSWIQYGKPYFKINIGAAGLYEIKQSDLVTMGWSNIPMEQFQLWRNGKEQPLISSKISGVASNTDYLRFWGELNDGSSDTKMYLKPNYQLSDYYSLMTDTSAYFLTINAGTNLRYQISPNVISGNTLAPEPYFMNKRGIYYRNKLNPGYALPAGDIYVYSSSYDMGEGWTSADIYPAGPLNGTINNLNVYTGGPNATIDFGMAGSAFNSRKVKLTLNGTEIFNEPIAYLNHVKRQINDVPVSVLSASNAASFVTQNTSTVPTDRVVVSHISVVYPSKWNFNNQSDFYFELPPSVVGNYLEIENFNSGNTAPLLLDITNQKMYEGDISTPGKIKFALPPSTINVRKFRLVNISAGQIKQIPTPERRDFIDYSQATNQGDYLIISNPKLFNDGSGVNNVALYNDYRRSAAGGNYSSIVIDVNQLIDQFAYGIKKHPAAIKDFIAFAKNQFSITPKFVFLIGKGITYDDYTKNQSGQYADQLNLVPTFGSPASDVLLVSPYGSAVPTYPVGRLSSINGKEVGQYLEKVKEYEAAQQSSVQTLENKSWMKNNVQIVGGKEVSESNLFQAYMNQYKKIIEDTLFGAHTELFIKTSNAAVQLIAGKRIEELFKEGISLLAYFGHSSANTLEFNLSDPNSYTNPGKYPMFYVSGCTAGNNYVYDSLRIKQNNTSISENFILAKQRGSIAFLASTHYGIPNYLNAYNVLMYKKLAAQNYGQSIGEMIQKTVYDLNGNDESTYFFTRADYEENNLHGDPSLKLNPHPKPDYIIEEPLIKINPAFISVSEDKFVMDAKVFNIGRAVNDSIIFQVKRTYPNGSSETLLRKRIKAPNYVDSVRLVIPIISTRDKGLNKITVTIDADNEVDEMSKSNNSVTKEFYIFEDEARPAFPGEFAIVTDSKQKLYGSTADPFSTQKEYVMELDTTNLFNSSTKVSKTLLSTGGLLEFDPGITYTNNTVYYWRIANKPASGLPADYHWNVSSFIYLNGGSQGANQSHYYQHLVSDTQNISLTTERKWQFSKLMNTIGARNTVYPTGGQEAPDHSSNINGLTFASGLCYRNTTNTIIFNVIDPLTLKPWKNDMNSPKYGSNAICDPSRLSNFAFDISTPSKRNVAKQFLDLIPTNFIVIARNVVEPNEPTQVFANTWKKDENTYGANNTMYALLKNQGFNDIDSFSRPLAFIFMYQKNNASFGPTSLFTKGINDKIDVNVHYVSSDSIGFITSPKFGPALDWKQLNWDGRNLDATNTDATNIEVIGFDPTGNKTVLMNVNNTQRTVDLSSLNAKQYPYLQLRMRIADSIQFTPFQLDYWRLHFTPAPEGALNPKLFLSSKDSLDQGEPLNFGIAFQNISKTAFDSVKVKMVLIDKDNVSHSLTIPKQKPLAVGDTILLKYNIDTRNYSGKNTLLVDFNPDNDQPEQQHFNNFFYKDIYVKPDVFNPLLDVTFDGVHILNRDIVSAKPQILIKLKDESKFLALNDTSLFKVQIRYPDGNLKTFRFDNDTMRFIPADLSTGKNTATIDLRPALAGEDAEYELMVTGKDAMGNPAGELDYRINFKVMSKPMISNFLNYPNPFTTSTAFVFTITGSEVPQNIRIQILTITGKVIREITSQELGPLHIGRNITDFKWDGTDMYGQKVANGVYLYRVLTNLNGASLGKYKADGDDTDKYFIKGYGKMYFMR